LLAIKENKLKKLALTKMLFLFFFVSILSVSGFSQKETISSRWAPNQINIDGRSDDWKDEAFHFEKKLGIDYSFKNDAENLFILFVFKDPRYLSSINDTGMTIWFNLEGKKKKNFGIQFIKKSVSPEVFISLLEEQKGALSEEEKNNIRANRQFYLHNAKVISKGDESSSRGLDAGETQQAIFRTTKQKEGIVYEFAVPLRKMTEPSLGIGTEPGKTINLAFEWGGMTPEMKEAMLKRLADSGGTPAEPARSGGSWSKGSSYGRGMPKVGKGPRKHSFWVQIKLSESQGANTDL
jgi:hypothetical protein